MGASGRGLNDAPRILIAYSLRIRRTAHHRHSWLGNRETALNVDLLLGFFGTTFILDCFNWVNHSSWPRCKISQLAKRDIGKLITYRVYMKRCLTNQLGSGCGTFSLAFQLLGASDQRARPHDFIKRNGYVSHLPNYQQIWAKRIDYIWWHHNGNACKSPEWIIHMNSLWFVKLSNEKKT